MNAKSRRRLLAGAGGLGALLLVAWVLLGGGRAEQARQASPVPSHASAAASAAVGRPAVPPIDPCGMLELDQIDEALGLTDLPSDQRNFFTLSGGEACAWQHDPGPGADGASVGVQPGAPEDFLRGAALDGVAGQPVTGIGDAASWFGADRRGVLSVVARSTLGYLFVRVTVDRPEIKDADRLAVARTVAEGVLPQFPGMQAAVEPGRITIEHPPPDVSTVSLAGNVLARELAGEWTRGEGLVAALRLVAGEATEAEIVGQSKLLDGSATGVIAMAREYIDRAPTGESATEVRRLLGLLTAHPGGDTSLRRPGEPVLAAYRSGPLAQASECGSQDPSEPGWTVVNAHDDVGYGQWQVVAFFPAGGGGGWVAETHLQWALDALDKSAEFFDAETLPCIHLIFASAGGLDTYVADNIDPNICGIFVNPPMQHRPEDQFKQRIALEVAHCAIPSNFPEQYGVATYESRVWWNHALAWYLSNAIYPAARCGGLRCDLEWQFAQPLAAHELALGLVDRVETNWLFFQHVVNTVGDPGLGELIESLPATADRDEHEAALADFGGMAELFHDFARLMSDGAVRDSGGGVVPYIPPSDRVHIGGPLIVTDEPQPLGVTRLHLMVDAGQFACLEHDVSEDVAVSWRPGRPGGGPTISWSTDLPTSLSGEAVLVATTTQPDGEYTLWVTAVDDEADCPEDDEPTSQGDACLELICEPSSYYRSSDGLPDGFEENVPVD
jgi:hypothetical protein